MERRLATLILSCSMVPAALAQQQPDAAEVMRKVGEKYASAKRFELAGTINVKNRRSSDGAVVREENIAMHVAFEGPDRVVLEGAGVDVDGINVYSDGKKAWAYSPTRNVYMPLKPGPAPAAPLEASHLGDDDMVPYAVQTAIFVMKGFRPSAYGSFQILRQEKLDARDCYVISIHDGTSPPAGRLVWVDKNRFVILRMEESFDGGGKTGIIETTTALYTTAKIDEPLPESLFTFTPPPGAKQVDSLKLR